MSILGWNSFFVAVMHLRMAQKEYEKNSSPVALSLKQKYENEIDDFIEDRTERMFKEKQKALFGGEKQ